LRKENSIYQSWILYDEIKDVMFCSICIKAGERIQNIWGDTNKGCSQFTKKSCDQQLVSASHKRSVKFEKDSKVKITIYLNKEKKEPFQDISIFNSKSIPLPYKNLFENIYWACKQELSLLTVISLNEFSRIKLDVNLPDHLSPKSIVKIVSTMSKVITEKLLKDITKNSYIGISIDDSKDIADKEILLLYVKYFSKTQKK